MSAYDSEPEKIGFASLGQQSSARMLCMPKAKRAAKIAEGRLVLRDEAKPQVEIALYRMGRREPVGAVLVPRDMLAWYAHTLLSAALRPVDTAAGGEGSLSA